MGRHKDKSPEPVVRAPGKEGQESPPSNRSGGFPTLGPRFRAYRPDPAASTRLLMGRHKDKSPEPVVRAPG